MTDISVKFAGLELKSPVIVSSSGLTNSLSRLKKMEDNGAGAVILKSLFEEQIMHDVSNMGKDTDYPEAEAYIARYAKENSVGKYLDFIKEARQALSIPVIASVNCYSNDEWVDFTARMEEAGADAIELNIYFLANDKSKSSAEYEQAYIEIVESVCKKVNIPVLVKLGLQFTNLTWLVEQLRIRGAAAVTLFNRFYAPDINTNDFSIEAAEVLSTPADLRNSLRWVGIISSQISNIDISASTGVHSGIGAVKQLLAGAEAVQVCSVLYRNGIDYIKDINSEIKNWMDKKKYHSISEFKGKMSYSSIDDPAAYERAQFIKYFSKMH